MLKRAILAATIGLLTAGCTIAAGENQPPGVALDDGVKAAVAVPPPPPVRKESNVPMRAMLPGETPPQFVLFSFDGVGLTPNWDMFLETADEVDARFTALMTGLYFVADENREVYTAPGHAPGDSAIAFGGTVDDVQEQVKYLNKTYYEGHEMGTHYVGHFCAGSGSHGNQWTTADWNHELGEFFKMMNNWQEINNLTGAEPLAFGPQEVKGGRTQCLEGQLDQLIPAWLENGMTWDSSMPSKVTGLIWPERIGGIWEFAVPYVYSPAIGAGQTALDYNFWYSFNKATDQPETAPEVRQIVRDTYQYMYDRAVNGNRAPLVIANHFNSWNGNSFNPATADFMRDVCGNPGTICATYSDVVEWMELQDPAILAQWQAMPPVAGTAET